VRQDLLGVNSLREGRWWFLWLVSGQQWGFTGLFKAAALLQRLLHTSMGAASERNS
jgi:hypothetical protein